MLSSLETYISGGGKPIRKGLLGGRPSPGVPSKLEDVKIEPKDVSSIQDTVFAASNQAHSRLVKRTGQVAIANKLDADNKREQKERAAVGKQKRPPKPQPELTALVAAAAALDPPPPTPVAKRDLVQLPMPATVEVQINTLEQHKRRDEELALFAVTIERPHRATNDIIVNTASDVNVLAYCAQFKTELPWYKNMQQAVANSPNLTFQRMPVFCRAVLMTFMRMPDPAMPFERPCFNLDREPMVHENRVRCIAHRVSEKRLGPGRGYRLREVLFNEQSTLINADLEHNARVQLAGGKGGYRDPCARLHQIPELCYMCHVWMTTEAALDQKNKAAERERKDLTVPSPQQNTEQMCGILNRFMVDVGKPGEYDIRKMLVSDDVALGIWGPFPMWNERNYIPVRIANTNLWGFEETDDLLFRLPRVPLQVIESSSPSGSIPSNPTTVATAVSNSHP